MTQPTDRSATDAVASDGGGSFRLPRAAAGRYAPRAVKMAGSYKVASRNRSYEAQLHPALRSARRVQRILDSLRLELAGDDGSARVRVRRILSEPVEVFRLEFERPELSYQRVTLLDRDCLEELLETDGVRERLTSADPF